MKCFFFPVVIFLIAIVRRKFNIVKQFTILIRYFIGIPSMRPGQRHLYRVSSILPNMGSPLYPAVCLTCTTSSGIAMTDEHRGIGGSSKNSLINRNEWQDHYESPIDDIDHKEHRQTKDKKDKSKSKNISSEFYSRLLLYFFVI